MNSVYFNSVATASMEKDRRTTDFELLQTHLALYGYEVSCDVPYDGDCFFHAICVLVERTDAKALRRELVYFINSKVNFNVIIL